MIFDSEDKKHLKRMNQEFGDLCTRVGRLEGKIEEGFGGLTSSMKWIERRFGDLQCQKHTDMMIKLEGRMANMEGRNWIMSKNRRALAVFITGVVTALLVANFKYILNFLGI